MGIPLLDMATLYQSKNQMVEDLEVAVVAGITRTISAATAVQAA